MTVGFELGQRVLKMISVTGSEAKESCLVPVPDNMVAEDGSFEAVETLAELIRSTAKTKGFSGDAAVVLPASAVSVRNITVPRMKEADLRAGLPYEFRDYLTQDKSQYLFDYVVTGEEKDETGKTVSLDLLVAAVQKSVIESYRSLFSRAGFKLKIAVPEEYALAGAMHIADPASGKGDRCIVNIGQNRSRLYIFRSGVFESVRTIEIGVSRVDAAITRLKGVDLKTAVSLRESDEDNVLSDESCRQVFHDLASEIIRAVNFYNYNNREAELTEVYLTGEGAELEELADVIAEDARNFSVKPVSEAFSRTGKVRDSVFVSYGAVVSQTSSKKLNLFRKDGLNISPAILIPSVIVLGLLAGMFLKFGVIDPISRLHTAQQAYAAASEEYDAVSELADTYDDVRREYRYYAYGFVNDGSADRLEVMDLVEDVMMVRGTVSSYSVYGSVLNVSMSGMTLEEISDMMTDLGEYDIVESVFLNQASTDRDENNKLLGFQITVNLVSEEGGEEE